MRHRRRSTVLATVMLMGASAIAAYAASGDLDTSFSGDGRATPRFGRSYERGYAVAVQPDDKIVVVGTSDGDDVAPGIALARFKPGGSLDTTFGGGDGKVVTRFPDWSTQGRDMVLTPSGKIIVVGHIEPETGGRRRVLVARYLGNGTLDTTFDSDGVKIFQFGGVADNAEAVALSGSRIIVVGYTENASGPLNTPVIAQLTSAGSLDTSFSGDGKARLNLPHDATAEDVALHDGRIVIAGDISINDGQERFLLARATAGGIKDSTFGGGDGWTATRFATATNSYSNANSLATTPAGRIIVGGYANAGEGTDGWAAARYMSNGSLDSSFSGDGKFTEDSAVEEGAFSVIVQPDSRIVLAGYSDEYAAVLRLTSAGALDTTFTGDGLRPYGFGSAFDYQYALDVVWHDGKLVLVGHSLDEDAPGGEETSFTVARLLGS